MVRMVIMKSIIVRTVIIYQLDISVGQSFSFSS